MKKLILGIGILSATLIFGKTIEITPKNAYQIKKLLKNAKPGDEIVFEDGIYKRIPKIKISGNKANPIVIRGSEKTLIKNPVFIKGDYLIIKNLYIKGNADKINYNQVIKEWWNPSNEIKKSGLYIEGRHVLVKDNVICNFPGSGLRIIKKSDYVTVKHNIVCNNAWWSTGGTGGLIVRNIIQSDNSKKDKIKILNNLIFSNESRIISHVYQKGFTKMVIDEGEGLLIQQKSDKDTIKNGHYNGGFLVKNNLLLYNGKAISINKANNVKIIKNTLYKNGTTVTGKAGGIVLNTTKNDIIRNNLIVPSKGKDAIRKFLAKNIIEKNNLISYEDRNINLSSFEDMLRKYNLKVKPTNYKVNLKKQILDILKNIPKTNKTSFELEGNRLHIYNIDNKKIKALPKNYMLIIPKEYIKDIKAYLKL